MIDILFSLAAMATAEGPVAVSKVSQGNAAETECEVRFIAGERRARDIRVQCPQGTGRGAREAVIAQVDWRRRASLDGFHRDQEVTDTLDLSQGPDGSWSVRPERLMSVTPLYPIDEITAGHVANCRVRFDVSSGMPDVQGINCITDGNERDFERASRRAVESWIYTRNYNRSCRLTTISFGIQDEGEDRFGSDAVPADPPCPG